MKYKAILWDLDGTLLDTLDDLTGAVNYALAQYGYPARTREEVRRFVGNGIRKLIERALPGGADEAAQQAAHDAFCAYYRDHCNDRTRPYAGVLPLLAALKDAGIPMAIVSNKADFAVKELAAIYFRGLITVAAGARDGVRTKPAPDVVLSALRELNVPAEDAVYIGDSEVDVQTAKNAGMPCISVSWGFRDTETLRSAGASCICADADALREQLLP